MRRPDDEDHPVPEEKARIEYRREGVGLKATALIIASALLAIFVLQNLHDANFAFLFWDWDVALAAAIVVAAALGFVIGWGIGRMRRRGRRTD